MRIKITLTLELRNLETLQRGKSTLSTEMMVGSLSLSLSDCVCVCVLGEGGACMHTCVEGEIDFWCLPQLPFSFETESLTEAGV